MIKIIIFDFDDTLINNQILDFQSFRKTSLNFKTYVPTKKEIINLRKKDFLAKEIIKWLKTKSNFFFDEKNFFEERELFLKNENSIQYYQLRSFVRNTIKCLTSRNFILVIASVRKKPILIKKFLKKNQLLHYFDNICTLDNHKFDTRSLNHSLQIKKQIFKKILRFYKIKSNKAISIGNSITDAKAANSLGIQHIIFNTNKRTKNKKFYTVSSFKELSTVINCFSNLQDSSTQ